MFIFMVCLTTSDFPDRIPVNFNMSKSKAPNFDYHEISVLSSEIQKRRRLLVSGKLAHGVTKQIKDRAWEEVAEAVRLVSVLGMTKLNFLFP